MIVVIGGGILGLTAAYDLGRRGFRVTVLEQSPVAGGLAAPRRLPNGARLEHFYHHFFADQKNLMDLLGELGLAGDLFWRETSMGFFCAGEVHAFNGARDLLSFDPLPPADRLRFGLAALLLTKGPFGGGDRPAIQWLRRAFGPQATRTIWEPLLQMKFGSAWDTVSIGWLRTRLRDRQRGRSGGGREKLGYLAGSIGAILDGLVAAIEEQGNSVRLCCPVERIAVAGSRVRSVLAEGEPLAADAVIATVPSPVFCRLAPELPPDVAAVLGATRYQGSVCVTVLSRRPFTDHYWINVVDDDVPFVVAVEHTNFIEPDVYGGHLIYLGRYVERDGPEWRMTDGELIDSFLNGLGRLSPGFRRDDVIEAWVSKDPLTQPIFGRGYRKPDMETGVEGLFLANTSMLFPESRTIDSSIRLGREVGRRVAHSLR